MGVIALDVGDKFFSIKKYWRLFLAWGTICGISSMTSHWIMGGALAEATSCWGSVEQIAVAESIHHIYTERKQISSPSGLQAVAEFGEEGETQMPGLQWSIFLSQNKSLVKEDRPLVRGIWDSILKCVGPGMGRIVLWAARKQGGVLCLFFQPSLDIFSKII